MDIKEKITEIVEEAVARLKADDTLLKNFKTEPVKVLETLVGKDLPDEQIEKIIDLIKAKLAADDIADTVDDVKDALKGLKGLFGKK